MTTPLYHAHRRSKARRRRHLFLGRAREAVHRRNRAAAEEARATVLRRRRRRPGRATRAVAADVSAQACVPPAPSRRMLEARP